MTAGATRNPFGAWLRRFMDSQGPPITAAEVSRRTYYNKSTVSKWLSGEATPEPEALRILADTFSIDYGTLLTVAGYGTPADYDRVAALTPTLHPLAEELHRMLNPGSPLSADRRQRLEMLVDQVMAVERPQMRKRRTA